jgi:hypothetical protein
LKNGRKLEKPSQNQRLLPLLLQKVKHQRKVKRHQRKLSQLLLSD